MPCDISYMYIRHGYHINPLHTISFLLLLLLISSLSLASPSFKNFYICLFELTVNKRVPLVLFRVPWVTSWLDVLNCIFIKLMSNVQMSHVFNPITVFFTQEYKHVWNGEHINLFYLSCILFLKTIFFHFT